MKHQKLLWPVVVAAWIVGLHSATAQQLVMDNAPSGAGSFSQAVAAANSNPGSTITFTSSGQTIDQNVALPTLTAPVTINGGSGNTVLGDGINPVLNVNVGSGAFTYNTLTMQGSVGAAALGTNANGTIPGGNGGVAGAGGTGADGSTALQIAGATTITLNGTLTGGAGGSADGGSANGGATTANGANGGAGGTAGHGGTGGSGGAAVVVSGNNVTLTNTGTISGGAGGSANGGNALGGNATGSGSNGGTGGIAGNGGVGGAGGNGVVVTGLSFTLINSGTILHGANGPSTGGSATGGASLQGTAGANGTSGSNGTANFGGGAIVVTMDAATIIDSGTISGGGVSDAIDFTGTNNTIELEAGYSLSGNVFASQSGNLLELGGSGDATFDASRTDQQGANQFLNIVNFVKTGTSTWTLLNTSTKPTNWFIEQGTLKITSDAALGTGNSVVLMGGGELLTDQVGFVSTRTVNLQGNGTIAAVVDTDPNYYGGVTIQNPGVDTLTIGDATSRGSIYFRGNVSNGAGTLSLNIVNGTLSLDGANSYSGGTTISGANTIVIVNTASGLGTGTVNMSGGSLYINSGVSAGALTGTGGILSSGTNGTLLIEDNLAPAQTFAGTIENEGPTTIQIEKSGTGTEIFTGANTYTGNTTLLQGTLGAGSATAFGTGNFTNNGGTLEMAAGNHSLNIGGTYLQSSGTTLLSVLNGVSSEHIAVTSTASLGGNLTVDLAALSQPGTRGGTTPFTLLTSSALTGTYTPSYLNAPLGSSSSIAYVDNDVVLNVTTSAVLFPTGNLNGSQQGVAGAINRNLLNGNLSGAFSTVDAALANLYANDPNDFAHALDQFSPQAFGQFASVTAINNASFQTEAMDNYLAGERGQDGGFIARNGGIDSSGLSVNDGSIDPNLSMVHSRLLAWNPAPMSGVMSDMTNPLLGGVDMKDDKTAPASPVASDPWNFFVQGNVVLAQGSSTANTSHFDDHTESGQLGADYRITPHFLVGLAAGYAHTDASLDNVGSSATVDSYSPGIYASYADKGWYANFMGDYVYNSYTQSRSIPVLGGNANSATDGHEGVMNLDGGYDFHQGALTFGPLTGLQYTHLTVNGYQENGSAANLAVDEQEQDSLRSRLGGRVSYAFSDAGIVFTPHLDASWQHEFLNQSRGITSQFGFGGGSFAVQTDNPSRDSALVDLGLDADLNRSVKIFADYEVQAGQSNYFGQSINAGLRIGF